MLPLIALLTSPKHEQLGLEGTCLPAADDKAAPGMCVAMCVQGQSTKAQDPGAWATGIVEVALPVEYKMKNIEETEAAKRRLLHASRSAVYGSCHMSVNVMT